MNSRNDLLFVSIQLLHWGGIIGDVDWGRTIDLFNLGVMNLKEDRPLTEVLTARIPSAGGLIAGYFLGFRKG